MHIRVCRHERRLVGLLASKGLDTGDIVVPFCASCRFLGADGCGLGEIKPFQCRLYPLLFLSDGSLGVDPACAASGEYLAQLPDPASDARRHLEEMMKEASLLGGDEKRALADWSRYVCDIVPIDRICRGLNFNGEGKGI